MRCALVLSALLTVGCGDDSGFEPLIDTTLPTPDCFSSDPLRPTIVPLRATLRRPTGGLARTEDVTIRTNEPNFVRVLERGTFDALPLPTGFWSTLGQGGQVWAELTGGVNDATPLLSLRTDNRGAIQGLVWVDIPGICAANIEFSNAIVTLDALGSTAELVVRYGAVN